MKIVVTGANGFIAKNLIVSLEQTSGLQVIKVTRDTTRDELVNALSECSFVFHLAGVNRPKIEREFQQGNLDFTVQICDLLCQAGNRAPLVFASSTQAQQTGAYGESKRAAELAIEQFAALSGNAVVIYQLPNVFGKWSKPNYNTVVATFCHNVANGLPLRIDDSNKSLSLVYVDDVVRHFLKHLTETPKGINRSAVGPVYPVTLGELAKIIQEFRVSRNSLTTERVGQGLQRSLWATYLSFLPTDQFSYRIPSHSDARGTFVEMLKTKDSGQFSYFTAHPGVTRGGHFHHTKTEKFLVVKGKARFRFRELLSGEFVEKLTDAADPEVVETIPGWTHDITNIGAEEMVVMLWASEAFEKARPDTYQQAISNV